VPTQPPGPSTIFQHDYHGLDLLASAAGQVSAARQVSPSTLIEGLPTGGELLPGVVIRSIEDRDDENTGGIKEEEELPAGVSVPSSTAERDKDDSTVIKQEEEDD
jgi:hypothetical protein